MNLKSLHLLEYDKILAQLAEFTDFSGGHDLALAWLPTDDLRQAQAWQDETSEARRLLPENPSLHLGGVFDVRPLLPLAERGVVLRPPELLDMRSTLQRARLLQRALSRVENEAPRLAELGAQLQPADHITNEIARCISDHGDVLDSASDALLKIRRELKVAHDRLLTTLHRLVTASGNQPYLQEAIVTQRQGRYVIPLRAEFKGKIPGLIHDQSGSGATLFVEPLATIDLNNAWRQLQLAEEEEVERILRALTGLVAADAPRILHTVDVLARIDVVLARAKYADHLEATAPQLVPFRRVTKAENSAAGTHSGATLDFKRARHPLLNPTSVVPIDVWIDDSYYAVIITGPNTGGKTVALKTVGLLTLMAQSGFHLPVDEGSRLSVFESVYADIGDEQSIEQSLSTFSSHLKNIIDILAQADQHCLVLLDELGAGTDPEEGAALARALLVHLLENSVTTFATTHYSELKVFAQSTPGVKNASVEFDVETLSPTYELSIGLPGRSNALAIARRLGLPEWIVASAEALVQPDALESETLLAEIKAAKEAALRAQSDAEIRAQQVRALEADLRSQVAQIENTRRSILNDARTQAQVELSELHTELTLLRQQMKSLGAPGSNESVHRAFLAQAEAILAAQTRTHQPLPELLEPALPDVSLDGPIAVGDRVWVTSLQASGEVIGLEENVVQLMIGSFRLTVPARDVELRERAATHVPQLTREISTTELGVSPGLELDLRGLRATETIPLLEKYIDDAFLAGLPWVRIIHGRGTGALRRVVRDELHRNPLVTEQRAGEPNEGGDGVTVAHLARSG